MTSQTTKVTDGRTDRQAIALISR